MKQVNGERFIKQILDRARKKAYTATSFAMAEGYWLIGKRIVGQEQLGEEKGQYGMEALNRGDKQELQV